MTSTTDYTGRVVDVLAVQDTFVLDGRAVILIQELAGPGNPGRVVAGILKLVQRVLLALLTPRGSKLFAPTDGTDFMNDCNRGRWRTAADVRQSFVSARVDVRRQLVADETNADPADERYGSLDLVNVVLAGDAVSITLLLHSLAGTAYTLITPVVP